MNRCHFFSSLPAIAILLWTTTACQTVLRPDAIDLDQPGWEVREGNGIWKSSAETEELITDVIFATHESGRVFLQVSKDVLPMITIHILKERWVIESPAGGRAFEGTGDLPGDIVWVQLAAALSERALHPDWTWHPDAVGGTMENAQTGEMARVLFLP